MSSTGINPAANPSNLVNLRANQDASQNSSDGIIPNRQANSSDGIHPSLNSSDGIHPSLSSSGAIHPATSNSSDGIIPNSNSDTVTISQEAQSLLNSERS